jgi:alternate signal-mediated exported protein
MKNATKAVIAGVAGIALLTGGAGSLAYWNDTKAGGTLAIQSGTLNLGTIADGTWTLTQNSSDLPTNTTASTSTTYVATGVGATPIVPGDTLSQTVQLPITITGTHNKARVTVTGASVAASSGAADVALAAALKPTIASIGSGTTSTLVTASGNVPVVVSIVFPWKGVSTDLDNATKLGNVTYTLTYTVTQVPFTATS